MGGKHIRKCKGRTWCRVSFSFLNSAQFPSDVNYTVRLIRFCSKLAALKKFDSSRFLSYFFCVHDSLPLTEGNLEGFKEKFLRGNKYY